MKCAPIKLSLASSRREEFGFRFLCLAERELVRDRDIGVQFGIEPLDARERDLGELNGGELALAEEFSDLFYRSESELSVVPAQNIFS